MHSYIKTQNATFFNTFKHIFIAKIDKFFIIELNNFLKFFTKGLKNPLKGKNNWEKIKERLSTEYYKVCNIKEILVLQTF